MEKFLAVWPIVGLTIIVFGIFYAGFTRNESKHFYRKDFITSEEDLITRIFVLGITWPLVLSVCLIALPFWLLFKFGEFCAVFKRKNK